MVNQVYRSLIFIKLLTETLITGKGTPCFIFESFTDTVSDSFTIVCDFNHEEKIY